MSRRVVVYAIALFALSLVDLGLGRYFRISLTLVLVSLTLPVSSFPECFVEAVLAGLIIDLSRGSLQGQYLFSLTLAATVIYFLKGTYAISKYALSIIFFGIVSVFLAIIQRSYKVFFDVFVFNTMIALVVALVLSLFKGTLLGRHEKRI